MPPFNPTACGGILSPYLVGSYDLREVKTVLQVINPSATSHIACIVLFDSNGAPTVPRCTRVEVKPNGLVEIDVAKLKPKAPFGVVKVVCLNPREDKAEYGFVGYQRKYYPAKVGVSESILHPVPMEVLMADWKQIMSVCKE